MSVISFIAIVLLIPAVILAGLCLSYQRGFKDGQDYEQANQTRRFVRLKGFSEPYDLPLFWRN